MARTSHRLALATGLTYHLHEWEGPRDVTFVLVHGFTDLGYGWRTVAEHLAPHGHVIAPDLRGHGDSDWIGAGGYYHFMDYVADLDDVIAQRVTGRLVLVGHSMGGSVAAYWAGTRPERASALALLEGIGPPDMSGFDGPTRTAHWIDSWRAARGKVRALPSLADAARRLRAHDPLLSEELALDLAEHGTRLVDGGPGRTWKHDPLHLTIGPYTYRVDAAIKYWQRITCPVLIVDGAQSTLNLPEPERASRRAQFANHTHEVIEGAGHMLTRHQPARVAELILELTRGRRSPGR